MFLFGRNRSSPSKPGILVKLCMDSFCGAINPVMVLMQHNASTWCIRKVMRMHTNISIFLSPGNCLILALLSRLYLSKRFDAVSMKSYFFSSRHI